MPESPLIVITPEELMRYLRPTLTALEVMAVQVQALTELALGRVIEGSEAILAVSEELKEKLMRSNCTIQLRDGSFIKVAETYSEVLQRWGGGQPFTVTVLDGIKEDVEHQRTFVPDQIQQIQAVNI